nr:MAG TPA: Structural protein [Caudoviricetes sp.]
MQYLDYITSAIENDIVSGYPGLTSNLRLSREQLEDDVIDERLTIIKEYAIKGILPNKDLWMSINCLEVDCKPIEKCSICTPSSFKQTDIAHVEIPQIVTSIGNEAVEYFGSIDRNVPFTVYTDISYQYHQYNRAIGKKPYVYIDTTPNENNFYDCYIFNAPLLKTVSIIAIFKDPRQLLDFTCCNGEELFNFNSLTNDIKRRVTEKKVRWYRQYQYPPTNNDQTMKP